MGPPDSNRFRSGLDFGDGEPDGGVVAGLVADALAEPGFGVPGGADASHSSTVTVQVAFADPMLR